MKKYNATVNNQFTRVSILNALLRRNTVILISALLLASLFIYAAFNKLLIYDEFITQLQTSPITKGFENFLAWIVPGVELGIALLLIVKRTRFIGLWSSFIMMFIFTAYVFSLPIFFSTQLPCSCGGIISKFGWIEHFWFNASFTLMAALAITLFRRNQNKI